MPRNKCWIIVIITIICSSCDSNRVFEASKSIPNQWHKDSIITFNMSSPDSINPYNLFVNLKNTSKYQYSNLFLIIEMNYPHGKTVKDTLEYQMTQPNGEFLGTSFNTKTNKLWYKGFDKPFIFNEIGDYKINIQHVMRKNGSVKGIENLKGITDVGFRVEHSKN